MKTAYVNSDCYLLPIVTFNFLKIIPGSKIYFYLDLGPKKFLIASLFLLNKLSHIPKVIYLNNK